jgi:hypothetical protein
MLIEFDMLFAVFALTLVLPVSIFQIAASQKVTTNLSKLFSDRLVFNSNLQKLAFQLGSLGAQPPITALLAGNDSNYLLIPYNQTSSVEAWSGSYLRMVVAGGRMYYLSVDR